MEMDIWPWGALGVLIGLFIFFACMFIYNLGKTVGHELGYSKGWRAARTRYERPAPSDFDGWERWD